MDVLQHLVDHHVDSLTAIIASAATLADDVLDQPITQCVEGVDDDPTLRGLINGMVTQEEHWLNALAGGDWPDESDRSMAGLAARHEVAGRDYRAFVARRSPTVDARHLRRHDLRAARHPQRRRHHRPRDHLRRRTPHDGGRGAVDRRHPGLRQGRPAAAARRARRHADAADRIAQAGASAPVEVSVRTRFQRTQESSNASRAACSALAPGGRVDGGEGVVERDVAGAVTTTVAMASTSAAIAHGRAGPPRGDHADRRQQRAPTKVAMKTGLTIERLTCCIASTNVASSVFARPGITPLAQV